MILNTEGLSEDKAACPWQRFDNAGNRDAAGGSEPDHPHPVAQQQAKAGGAFCAAAGY